MDGPRDLTHDVHARDWQEYADDCLTHDPEPCVVSHAHDLAHSEDRVLAFTASTN